MLFLSWLHRLSWPAASRLPSAKRPNRQRKPQEGVLALTVEGLEARQVLTGTVVVNTFNDLPDADPLDGVADADLATPGLQTSLRAAVMHANVTPGLETIVLSAGTYQLTIDGSGEDNSETGDLDLFSDIEIIGAGSQNTIVKMGLAGGTGSAIQDRVFDIAAFHKVLIQGVKIQDGHTVGFDADGGGIRANGDLELRGVMLTNNQTDQSGGGLAVGFTGSVMLVGSTVTSNFAVLSGGGLASHGTLKVYDSEVSNNTSNLSGGGITSSAALEVVRSLVQGNTAEADGGGISLNSGSATIIGSVIKQNVATNGRGGGLSLGTNINDTLSSNESADLLFSEFAENEAQDGGGISMNSGGTLSLRNSALADNEASGTATVGGRGGGLLHLRGNTVVSETTFSGNSTTSQAGATANEGGGLFHQGGQLSLVNATIANNSAGIGGGINSRAVSDPSKNRVSLRNTIVATNTATLNAADLVAAGATLVSEGHNLIGVGTAPFVNGVNGDKVGTAASPLNPQLAPLGNYGGGTRTQKLNSGSPAIDAGSNLDVSDSDQRGVPRTLNGGTSNTTDIGAVEAGFTGFFVNTTADTTDVNPGDGFAIDSTGKTSLRAAIQEANALAGLQTIVVPAGNYRLTRTGANENAAATGDLDITQSVNIRGAGGAATIIDGNFTDRVFDIFAGAATTISGLSITNGQRNAGGVEARGGGLRINSASVLLDRVVVRNNVAADVGGGLASESFGSGGGLTIRNSSFQFNQGASGGAINNFNDTLVIEHSLFESNTTTSGPGGALAHVGPGTISDSRFSHNVSTSSGGAIAISQNLASPATTTISHSEISENTSSSGGGIQVLFDTLNLNDSVVAYNTAAAGFGGGLLVDQGTLNVLRSSVYSNNNQSVTGLVGGAGIAAIGAGATLNVTESQINGNTSNLSGGGLFLQPSTTTSVLRSTISRNTATDGGGIFNAGTLTIANSTISQNSGGGINGTGNGGGLFDSGTTTISSSTFSTNSAALGGGIFAANVGARSLKNTIVAGNFSNTNHDADLSSTTFTTNGNNLIGDIDAAVGLLNETNGDIVGGDGGEPINSVSDNNTSPIVVTATGHGLQTGDRVRIVGVTGNNAANGIFTVTRIDANQFSLNNSVPNGNYGGGGDFFFLIDPRLGPLANNTNPFAVNQNFGLPGTAPAVVSLVPQTPETHALLLGSPAIDRGNDLGAPTTDQRGFARVDVAGVGAATTSTDIGAVELFHTTASGVLFSDLNGNGVRDLNEPGRGGVTVYLDSNANGSFDPGEPFTTTAFFDDLLTPEIEEVGSYTLTFIPPGTQLISEVLPFNSRQTTGVTPLFGSATQIAAGADPSSVITGDFNNDGAQDVAFVQTSANLLTIVPGLVGGLFGTPISFTVGSTPKRVVAGDLNGDGRLDLVVVNKDSNNLSVFFSNGNGFDAPQSLAVGTSPRAIVLADLDHDGDLDIAVANEGSDDVSLLEQTSPGVFSTLQTVSVGDGPRDIIATDWNNDGQIDLVTADKLSNEISLLRNNNSGITFTRTAISVPGTLPSSLLSEDVDRDGDVDLVFGAVGTGKVLLLENSGMGMFGPPVTLLSGVNPTSLGSADVDFDGDFDLFVPTESASGTITVLVNDNGAFLNSFVFATGSQPAAIAFADFNGDGRHDVITANIGGDNVTVLTNLTGSYSVAAQTGMPLSNLGFGIQDLASISGTIFNDLNSNGIQDRDEPGIGGATVFVDLNGNGRKDSFEPLTTTSSAGAFGGLAGGYFFQGVLPGKYRVYQMPPPGFVQTAPRNVAFDEGLSVPSGNFISDVIATDLNHDGLTDVVSVSREISGNGLAHIFLGTANGPGSEIVVSVGSQPKRVLAADLDHDGDLDLLVMNSGDNSVSLIRNDAGSFSVVSTLMLNHTPNDLAVGDLNGDGDADIVVSETVINFTDSVELFLSLGDLTFHQRSMNLGNNDTSGIALADLDNDHDLDLVAVDRMNGRVRLFANIDMGSFFIPAGDFLTDPAPGAVVIGYFNGDSFPDIAVTSQAFNQVVYHNSSGPFTYGLNGGISTTALVSDLVVADVNRDGLDDLAVTTTDGKLIVAEGALNGLFQSQSDATFLAGTTGSALAFGDFNDGKLLDVIIGQDVAAASLTLGLNRLFGAAVNLVPGGFTNVNFGRVELGTIRGRIFLDTNANGVRDPGEDDGFGGLQVFADINHNGRHDSQEPFAVTKVDSGTFTINDVPPNQSLIILAEPLPGTLRTGPFGLQYSPPSAVTISAPRPQLVSDLIATADLNFDGVPEVIAINPHDGSLTVTSRGNNGPTTLTYGVGTTPTFQRVGRLNNNFIPDIVVANNGSNSLTIFLDGNMASPLTITGVTDPRALELIDVNNDGALDVVVTSSSSGNVTILINNGFGSLTVSNVLTVTGADSGEDIARADVNGDGVQDLVFIDSSNDKAFVLRNNSNGTLTQIGTIVTGETPVSLNSIGDFDADSDQDFILTAAGDQAIQVLLNDGSGNFTAVTKATLSNTPGAIDYSIRDHRVVVTLPNQNQLALFTIMPDGTFSPPSFVHTNGGQDSVRLADLNKDGKDDLLSTVFGNGELNINDDWTSPIPGTYEVRVNPGQTLDELVFATQDLRSTAIVLNGNNLQIDDILGGNSSDNWSLTMNGSSVTLHSNNPNELLTSGIAGVTGDGTDSLTIPLAAFSGGIIFNGGAGADTLTLNVTAGFSRTITFNGGAPTSGSGDTLILQSAGTFDSATYSFADASSGSIQFSGNGLINYSGLEPIVSSVAADDVSLQFGSDSETIQVTAGSIGQMIVDSTSGESLTFLNPNRSLTILSGGGNDTIDIMGVDTLFRAALTIDGEVGNDTVQLDVSLLLGSATSNGNLTLTAERISLNAASIATNGDTANNTAGAVTLNGAVTLGADVTINTDSSTTSDGAVFLDTVDSDDTLGGGQSLTITSGSATTTFNNFVGATIALSDLDVTAAVIALNSDIRTDGGSLTFNGDTRLGTDVLIDTEQGNDNAAGSVTFSNGSASAVGTIHSLTINTSTSGSNNSGAVTLNSVGNAAGQFLSSLTINATNAGSGAAGDVTFTNGITLENDGSFDASGRTISLSTTNSDVVISGTGTVTLIATRDITLSSGANIQTVNGDLSLEANQQASPTTGTFVGIRLDNATLQTNGSGNISLLGKGGNANSFNHGIVLENGATIRSTDTGVSAGTISLTGKSGSGVAENIGVKLSGASTEIQSVDGNISLNGTGGSGTGDRNDGVDVRDGAVIRSTGTAATAATITITGTAGAGASDNDAVQISGIGSLVVSQAGNIEITGTGGASTGDSNDGVILLDGGQVISTGTGANVASITINGTGGSGTDGNNGVVIEGTDALIRSVEGTISLTGGGGTGSDGFHRGIFLLAGGHIESTGTGSNAANITLDGTGGVGNGDGSRGIQMQTAATTISTVDGDVRVIGNGGSGTGFNQGIMQFGGTITSTGTTAGAGKITLIGGGGSGTGGHDTGVFLFDNEAILMTSNADISVVGTGGGTTASSGNWGIEVSGIISAGGSGVTNLNGTGGSGSGGDNVGLSASSNAKISTAGGALNLFGTSGSGAASPAFRTSTSGTVAINTDLTGPINIIADSIKIGSNTTLRAGNAGSSSLTILPQTNGVAFNIGSTTDNAASTIELSDAELDRINASTINLGNANTGAITVSNAISRPNATNLNLTAGSNKDIAFSGGTAGLNANGGNVTLTNSGTGAITSGTAPNDIIANRVALTSGNGGIGASGNPLSFDANQLVTNSSGNANQFLKEAGSVLIDVAGLTAGTGTIQFSGGTFTLNGSNRIADSTLLDVPSGATFKLNGFLETVAGLTGNGSVLNGSATAGSLTLSSSSNTAFDGVFGGATANDKKFSLNKSGIGTLTLTGTNTFTGLTTIDAGKLLLNGSLTSDVIVASSGTFGGSGTIGGGHTLTINNGGTLAPGNSPGIINSGSVTFNSGSTFNVELNGTTVGTGYDQLNVTGTVDLNGATLDAILGFTPAAGATFVIVNNDGSDPINGTFGSLSQGALLTIGGKKFHIYYDFDNGGGQTNDVALIVNRAPQFNAQTFNLNENSANNTTVGTAVASDADGGSLNYAITAGNTSNAFAINATTGAIRVNNAAAIDFETNPVFSLTVDVTDDAGAVTTKTITINLNDLQSNLSINNPSTSEGDSGTKTLTFSVKSSAVINNAFTIDFNTSKDTAGDGLLGSDTDFAANSGTLNFAGNAANESKTVTITINGDTVIEGDETFNVLLSNLLGTNDVTITTATGAGTITNDDSSTLTISSPTITEGDSGTTTMTFTVTSPKAVEGGFTVAFSATDITANASDYTVVTSSPLTFSGTTNETKTITVNINGDAVIEGDETFSITLGTVTPVAPVAAASFMSGAIGTGTITNNDTSTLAISSPTITEANSGTTTMTFTVTSPKAVEGGFTVSFDVADITTNGSDYTVVTSSPLTFSGTENETKTITISVNGDTVIEGDETFSITLGTVTPVAPVDAASITTGAVGTGTITNNDTSTLTISSPTITEGDSGVMTMTFTVTSPNAVEGGFTVPFDVANVIASGSDYTVITSSPLTFSGTANETKTITINVNGDAVIEGDETFTITLGVVTPIAPVAAASITSGAVGTGTITNNDTSTLTISSPTITEANSGTTTMTFTITSPKAVEGGFTVPFDVTNVTTNGSDYTVVTSSPLTFSGTANETKTITINVNGDTIIEGDETFTITLGVVTPVAPVAAASITSGVIGTGTINNNDTSTLNISSPTITEGNSGTTTMTFTVTSPRAVERGFTVAFGVADITTNSSDNTVVTSSPLTFSGTANETKTITVNVNGDTVIEGNETFSITLGTVTPVAPVADTSITTGAVGTGTITNNDTSTLTISNPTVTEGDSGTTTMTFTVTSPKAVEGGFTVAFSVADITTNNSDYTVVINSPLTFTGTANETQTITLNINGDDLAEATETLSVTLGAVTPVAPVAAASISSDASGTGTITNDDFAPVASSGGPYRINEGSGLPLNASGTTDADTPASNLTYLWDIDGDGQFTENITGASPILAVSDLVTLGLSNGLRRNSITVQVSDGTNVSTASTQLTINNLPPSSPEDLLADVADLVIDGSPNGTPVGIQVQSSDPGNDPVTYRLTDNAGGRFAIDANTGEITIANSLLLNSQVAGSHIVTVVATDSDQTDSQPVSFTIAVQPAPPPTVSITPETAYVIEGDSGFVYVVFAVRLSSPSILPIDIDFTTLLSSEQDAARDTDNPNDINNPRDFYKTTGTVHFNPFSTEELIRIQIQPDLIAEMDETFLVQLTAATNADLNGGSPVASAIIRDDDTVPQLTISTPSVLEGDPTSGTPSELVYTLTVSGRFNSSGHASLHYETGTLGDTASPGVDYTTAFGDLDFSESQRTLQIHVPITGDLTDEADENVGLTFSNVSGLGVPVTPATGTIINDDSPNAVVQINSQVIREGTGFNSTAIFTVTLVGKPSGPVTLTYNTLAETATAGEDYLPTSGTLTFQPGGPVTQSIPVTIIGDSLHESAKETFSLNLAAITNATLDPTFGTGTGSILDDDGTVITSEADQIAAELTANFNQFNGDKNNPELVAALLNAAAGIASRLGFIKALVIVIDPVDFILNDTQGRQSGFTETTGVINQIPGTYYSGNGPVELLIVPLPPDGLYNLQLAGLGGPFNAAIAVTIGGETQTTSVSSSLENGSNLQVSINIGGTIPNSPLTLTIPVGLGLGGQPGNGNATFGVVGANDRFARRDFESEENEERQSNTELTLDESNDSPFDQLVNWIRIAQTTREKLVRQLFESLDLPFGNLLEPDSGAEQKLTDELVDLFWKRLGQTLTGVPAGAYKLGDMLENLLPQNTLRPSKKTPSEEGKGEPGKNGKLTPKTKRSTETRQRSVPRSSEKKSDTNQQRSQIAPIESLTAQLTDSETMATKPPQTATTLEAFWNWLSSSSRRS